MLVDEQWPIARLIPISSASGVEAQERRAASALLAVIGAVPEFGHSLLRPLGAPKGRIQTFIEIPFRIDGRAIRPDGIIAVTRGPKVWGAIVETKVGSAALERDQIDIYLDLARELGFDAVLSISNHFVTSSTQYPIEVDRRKARKKTLYHWSWIDVLTEAVVQQEHRGVTDPDQAYILKELIRYMSDPRSGVVAFDGMGPAWTKVRDSARDLTLRKTDQEVAAVAARWDDLIRYLGLELTKVLGQEVRQIVSKEERTPNARQNALKESLASSGRLYADLRVPNAAGPLTIVADLRSRQVNISTHLDAPKQGRAKGKVSWLVRQLVDAPETVKIEARLGRGQSLAALLSAVRENPAILYPEGARDIRQFGLSLTKNMGLKRDSSKGSFVETVMTTTEEFYRHVLQNIRAWKASPPKLKKPPDEQELADKRAVELPPPVQQAVIAAESEMEDQALKSGVPRAQDEGSSSHRMQQSDS